MIPPAIPPMPTPPALPAVMTFSGFGLFQRSTTASLRSCRGKKVEQGMGPSSKGLFEGPRAIAECPVVGGVPGSMVV